MQIRRELGRKIEHATFDKPGVQSLSRRWYRSLKEVEKVLDNKGNKGRKSTGTRKRK